MTKLRYSTLAILVALGSIACGGATEQVANQSAGDNADQSAAQAPAATSAEAPAEAPHLNHEQIAELLDDPDIFLLDVRNPDELPEQGAIEGYTLIPVAELADRLDELPRDKKILTI